MQDSSDEAIKQILVQADENGIKNLCSTNKRFSSLCGNQNFMEGVYRQKVENTISQDIINLREPSMSWKEFYTRVVNFKNKPLYVNIYCKNGDLLEIKLYANMQPPILPSDQGVFWAAANGRLNIIKYLDFILSSIEKLIY